jgi:hypothetical protein
MKPPAREVANGVAQPKAAVSRAGNSSPYEKIRAASAAMLQAQQSCGMPPRHQPCPVPDRVAGDRRSAQPKAASGSGNQITPADREFRLDQILTDLWHGKLSPDAAADRIMAELGMTAHRARDEVEGFLRDCRGG